MLKYVSMNWDCNPTVITWNDCPLKQPHKQNKKNKENKKNWKNKKTGKTKRTRRTTRTRTKRRTRRTRIKTRTKRARKRRRTEQEEHKEQEEPEKREEEKELKKQQKPKEPEEWEDPDKQQEQKNKDTKDIFLAGSFLERCCGGSPITHLSKNYTIIYKNGAAIVQRIGHSCKKMKQKTSNKNKTNSRIGRQWVRRIQTEEKARRYCKPSIFPVPLGHTRWVGSLLVYIRSSERETAILRKQKHVPAVALKVNGSQRLTSY